MTKDKTKAPTSTAPIALRDGFNPEEAQDVELSAKWFVCDAGLVHHFIAIERSDDVSDIWPDKDENGKVKAEQKPKHVYKCELLGEAVLMQDKELIQGKPGDLFLMFEPSRQGLKGLLMKSVQLGVGVTFVNHGKKSLFIRSQNAKRDVWDIKARVVAKKFAPLSNPLLLALPAADAVPEAAKESANTGE